MYNASFQGPRLLHTVAVASMTTASACLIVGSPIAGYLLLGPPGVICGIGLSLLFMSKRFWRVLLAPFGASGVAGDVIGECEVCIPGSAPPDSAVERRAEAEALLRYGIDASSRGR
jgi:hypothetical protein